VVRPGRPGEALMLFVLALVIASWWGIYKLKQIL
jgi:hypothetical protein